MMADGRFSSFRKEAKGYVHFLGARKRNQKNIHPYPSSPYMERLKLRTAETDSSECVLVSRDDAMVFRFEEPVFSLDNGIYLTIGRCSSLRDSAM